jgi:O-antigen ligase
MLAGLVATYFAGVPLAALTILQDGFLLLWGLCIANAVRLDPWLLRVVLGTWVRTGLVWAAVLCMGRLAGISWLAGMSASDGTRASLTFGDPNLAGNYFVACLAILLATSVVRHRTARVGAVGLILLAIIFTGSNGAAISVLVVLSIGLLGAIRRRTGLAAMVAVLALGGATMIALAPHVSLSQVQQRAADSVAVLHDSLGRANESSGTRETLIQEAYGLYQHGNLIGIGPARTQAVLQAQAAPYVKEAHDDYLASIVERGVGGAVGLVLLMWVVGTRFSRLVSRPQRAEVSVLVPRPEYLLGLVVAFGIAGFFYEVLHFRHLWALLGLGAGIEPTARRAGGNG